MISPKKQRGVTLLELLVAVIVLSILAVAMAPLMSWLTTATQGAYRQKAKLNNQLIADALMTYATASTAGILPAPYTGAGYTSTVYNPADASAPGLALKQALSGTKIPAVEINDDGTSQHNVRVYQLVSGLTKQVPLYSASGPLVTLTYQFGAIYQTACGLSVSSCNPGPAGVPGSSPVLTSALINSWNTTPTDLEPEFLSTLPIQQKMLATTVQNLDKVRDSLLAFLRASQQTAGGGDTTNWFPPNPGTMGGVAPGTNQGCRDGWYSLSASSVLPTVGLATAEYGATQWGGDIEYCRDYDPTATKSPNDSPHFAAIRFHSNVSAGVAPDHVALGNNVVLTF